MTQLGARGDPFESVDVAAMKFDWQLPPTHDAPPVQGDPLCHCPLTQVCGVLLAFGSHWL